MKPKELMLARKNRRPSIKSHTQKGCWLTLRELFTELTQMDLCVLHERQTLGLFAWTPLSSHCLYTSEPASPLVVIIPSRIFWILLFCFVLFAPNHGFCMNDTCTVLELKKYTEV